MQLYFVRHGRAESRETWPPSEERQRPLTKDGIKRMKKSAKTMQQLGLAPDAILTSPLARARQTAEIVAAALDRPLVEDETLAPGFGVSALTALLREYPDAASLMFVGHEPDFSTTVEVLIEGGRVMAKKGSLIRVDLFSVLPPRGELVWNIPPKMLVLE